MELELRSYTEFSRVVHDSVNRLRVPVNGSIEVTNRCPLTCSHCYNNLPMGDHAARRRELTLEQHKRIANEVVEAGCLWMLYTGGEIFARPDFLDIYLNAKRAGLLITLFTNGVLINERIADTLAEWRPFGIEITLYGRTRETYEKLTGIPGSFDRCLRGIDLLLQRGLPLKLKTVAVTVNKHEVMDMRDFAESLGCEFKFDPMINPRIDCSSSPLATRLGIDEIVALDLIDPFRVSEWKRLVRDFDPRPRPTTDESEPAQVYDCGGGVNSFAIDPYGQLTICVLSHVDRYDLKNGSFQDGWEHFLHGVRRKPKARVTKCTRCALGSMCGMCPAMGELENGDPEAPVDFLCATAHLRSEVFGIDVPEHGDCEYCVGGPHRARIDSAALRLSDNDAVRQLAMTPAAESVAAGCGSGGGCGSCGVAR
jgi:radical SAM protein with 4Fe4S-binding SPASM domain